MALGTTPAVVGATHRRLALRRALIYALGCVTGGGAIAYFVSMLAEFTIGHVVPVLAAGVLGAPLGALFLLHPERIPQRSWQVPRTWWSRSGDAAYFFAGGTLTTGIFTPIYFPTYYVLLCLAAALQPGPALLLGLTYGLMRSEPNWRAALGPPTSGISDPYGIGRRLLFYRIITASALGATSLAVAAVLIVDRVGGLWR